MSAMLRVGDGICCVLGLPCFECTGLAGRMQIGGDCHNHVSKSPSIPALLRGQLCRRGAAVFGLPKLELAFQLSIHTCHTFQDSRPTLERAKELVATFRKRVGL